MDALRADDRVTLVTFSEGAELAYRGTDKRAALAALPASPPGSLTDIGAGLEAGIEVLERRDARETAVLALVTDGTLDTADSSRFSSADSPGWKELNARAKGLSGATSVAAYAIALGSETDAGLLSDVFPTATKVPGNKIGPHLAGIDRELLGFQAAEKLRADATGSITATWSDVDWAALAASGEATGTLTFTSGLTALPVEVAGLKMSASGIDVTASGLPKAVTLDPGESQGFPVRLTAKGSTEGGSFILSGQVDSPWRKALSGFGVDVAPTLTATRVEVSDRDGTAAPSTPPTGLWLAAGGAAGVAALIGLVVLTRRNRRKLSGSLRVTRDGALLREFLLEGPAVSLGTAVGATVPGLSGRVVVGPRVKDGEPAVRIVGRLAADRVSTTLNDGESVTLGDVVLSYTAQHTRTVSMVKGGLEAEPGPAAPQ